DGRMREGVQRTFEKIATGFSNGARRLQGHMAHLIPVIKHSRCSPLSCAWAGRTLRATAALRISSRVPLAEQFRAARWPQDTKIIDFLSRPPRTEDALIRGVWLKIACTYNALASSAARASASTEWEKCLWYSPFESIK